MGWRFLIRIYKSYITMEITANEMGIPHAILKVNILVLFFSCLFWQDSHMLHLVIIIF